MRALFNVSVTGLLVSLIVLLWLEYKDATEPPKPGDVDDEGRRW